MVMKPNYRHERLTRERNKNLKKQDKLRRREEESTKRKTLREGEAPEPEKI
jgi:hypothetical protein